MALIQFWLNELDKLTPIPHSSFKFLITMQRKNVIKARDFKKSYKMKYSSNSHLEDKVWKLDISYSNYSTKYLQVFIPLLKMQTS